MDNEIKKLKLELEAKKNIVITTHKGADGDAIGSSLALYHFLIKMGHSVNVITPDEYANFLKWLPGTENVINYENQPLICEGITAKADLIFIMDLNHSSRMSSYGALIVESKATKILIDHHEDPDYELSDIIFSFNLSSSTAELLYEIIEKLELTDYIDKDIAECIYTGIMTDTGSFKYSCTTDRTHLITSYLIQKGANNFKIHDLIYDNNSIRKIKLLGYCLNNKMLVYPKNNSAIISLNDQELKKFNFQKGDTDGFVNYCLSIKNINFAVFIAEKDGVVKLSLRSKGNVKVNEIAKEHFNGGGHINASGGTTDMSVDQTIICLEKIIKNIKK